MPYEPPPSEREIVRECLKGNALYQKQLFEKHYGKMLGVCRRYASAKDEAQDILQEGFIKVFQNLEKFEFNCPLEAWIRRIIVNTAIDKYRSSLRQPMTNELETIHELAGEATILQDISHNDLLNMLQKLPAGYRLVFNMHVIEGYNHREIGEMIGITEGTSKSQLAKAKAFLQRLINREFSPRHE